MEVDDLNKQICTFKSQFSYEKYLVSYILSRMNHERFHNEV